jgi:hypothetical protein
MISAPEQKKGGASFELFAFLAFFFLAFSQQFANVSFMTTKTPIPTRPATQGINFKRTMSACGEIFRCVAKVNENEYRFEMALDKSWLNIIDPGSACETWKDEGEGLTFAGGEHITFDWSDADIARVDAAADAAK